MSVEQIMSKSIVTVEPDDSLETVKEIFDSVRLHHLLVVESAITRALRDNDTVTIIGFGTFKVGRRSARKGRNPRTGEELEIKAANVPKFTAGKALKDAVN